MDWLFWGMTMGVVGKVLVVLAVLHMHASLVREHKIDRKVVLSYRQERVMTFLGLILIVAGYLLEIYFFGYTPFSDCLGVGCAIGQPN